MKTDIKLVVNRKAPAKAKRPAKATPKNVLADALGKAATITDILIVTNHADGTTRTAWSDMKNSDLLWLVERTACTLKAELFQ